jgi:hypothetical protein
MPKSSASGKTPKDPPHHGSPTVSPARARSFLKIEKTSTVPGHRVHYALSKDGHTMTCYIAHPSKDDTQGFAGKFFRAVKLDHDDFCLKLHIDFITDRRTEADAMQPMKAEPNAPENIFWNAIHRYVQNTNQCTVENARKWVINSILKQLNVTALEYSYPPRFKIGDDFTATPVSPLSEMIVACDVVKIMMSNYSTMTLSDFLGSPEIILEYFNHVDEGSDAIEAYRMQIGAEEQEQGDDGF